MSNTDFDMCMPFYRFNLVFSETFNQDLKQGFVFFNVEKDVEYLGFADDFGPLNLGSVYIFC